MKAIESCRSCKYKFKDKKEMVKCTFCSYGGCKDCTKKTRYFPDSRQDGGVHELRGTICKLCDRKFFIHKQVSQTNKDIDMRRKTIDGIKQKKLKMKEKIKEDNRKEGEIEEAQKLQIAQIKEEIIKY